MTSQDSVTKEKKRPVIIKPLIVLNLYGFYVKWRQDLCSNLQTHTDNFPSHHPFVHGTMGHHQSPDGISVVPNGNSEGGHLAKLIFNKSVRKNTWYKHFQSTAIIHRNLSIHSWAKENTNK